MRKFKFSNELCQKLKLFTTIINKRFKYKKLLIDKEKGLVFISSNNSKKTAEIPLNGLSSGSSTN